MSLASNLTLASIEAEKEIRLKEIETNFAADMAALEAHDRELQKMILTSEEDVNQYIAKMREMVGLARK